MDDTRNPRKSQQLISYLALRKLIGTTGVLLPLILPLSCVIIGESTALQDSISDYYYTLKGEIFWWAFSLC